VLSTLFLLGMLGRRRPKAKFLNKQRQQLVLSERLELSHDTLRLRLALPEATPILGLPVGKHFKIFAPNAQGVEKGKWNGREDREDESEIERKYTPTTSDDEEGFVDLVIKVYKGGLIDRFPDGGKMSQYMGGLKVGDKVDLSGPFGVNEYLGNGKFKIGSKEKQCKALAMMSGGTGITPMLQVAAAILKDPSDPTTISLLYANQTENDILVRDLLDGYAEKYPKRFKVWYTLDRPPEGWKYSSGFITDAMIAEHLAPPGPDTLVLMCGPPPMINLACKPNLIKVGHADAAMVAF
jgi:cytochrome-b5 reductase